MYKNNRGIGLIFAIIALALFGSLMTYEMAQYHIMTSQQQIYTDRLQAQSLANNMYKYISSQKYDRVKSISREPAQDKSYDIETIVGDEVNGAKPVSVNVYKHGETNAVYQMSFQRDADETSNYVGNDSNGDTLELKYQGSAIHGYANNVDTPFYKERNTNFVGPDGESVFDNGVIMEWGRLENVAFDGGIKTVTFRKPIPNKIVAAYGFTQEPPGESSKVVNVYVVDYDNNSMRILCDYQGGSEMTGAVNWLVIGY